MAYEVINQAPSFDDFTPLSDHQEQTPGTFFGGKPVLHLNCADSQLRIANADLTTQSDFTALWDGTSQVPGDNETAQLSDIDVWVDSRHLTFWSTAKNTGIQIPYPTITIHALDGDAVLLQLTLSDQNTADEDLESLQLRITPTTAASEQNGESQTNGNGTAALPQQQLYDAISACQELNPDTSPEDDEDGVGFDETAPGATGWITSENMADFMDENGELRMPEGATMIGGEAEVEDEASGEVGSLGPGAGRRRRADEVDTEDGAEDEAKWQRTG